jgi:acetyltransferase-like isoleucine patch superfamily enzyme
MAFRAKEDLATQTIRLVGSPLPRVARLGARIGGRLRGSLLKLRLIANGGHVGKRLTVGRGVQVIMARSAIVRIGDRVSLGTGVVLSVGGEASVIIGDDVRLTHYTLVGAECSVSLADRVQVGEHCSIRDHDHDVSAVSMHSAPLTCSPVTIGEDSWIGRGVAVLRGTCIEPGAIIGANAVVRGKIPKDAIAVGIPAQVIRIRR